MFNAISSLPYLAGLFLAYQFNVDISTGAYPWADHMPLVAFVLGTIGSLSLRHGLYLIFGR